MNTFADFMARLAPGWLIRTPAGLGYQVARGEALDELMTMYADAVRARFVGLADADALYLLGGERGLDPFEDEPLENYRVRVQGAWDFWRYSGTNTGILLVLAQMGYVGRITEHFHEDPNRWAEFSIDFSPTEAAPAAKRYDAPDSIYDDPATTYDLRLRYSEINRVRTLLNKVKSAQSKLARLTFSSSPIARYDTPYTIYDDPATVYDAPDNFYETDL